MWVRQSDVSSSSPPMLHRTQYLDPIRARAHAAIVAYFFAQPQGEDVTLAVLLAVGEHRLRSLNSDWDQVKRDVGLLVPQMLSRRFGASNVETERVDDPPNRKAWNRPNAMPVGQWIRSYTRHRLLVLPQNVLDDE